MDRIFDIGMGLVIVAGVTTVVAHKQSGKIITAITGGLANNIRAATGR
jgi:hypothetical protein